MLGDIEDRVVVDLGCGTGRLAVGASILNAVEVICVDIDPNALLQAGRYLDMISKCPYHLIESDIRSGTPLRISKPCTVIMNPPFGIHSVGADMDFIKEAIRLCDRVYSLHKFSEGLLNAVKRAVGSVGKEAIISLIKEYRFPIKWFSPMHRRKVYLVNTVLLAITSKER